MKHIGSVPLALMLLAGSAVAAGPASGPRATAAAATRPDSVSHSVLQRHLAAFLKNDVDALVADYASDAVLITPDATYTGRADIRGFFEQLVPSFPTNASTLELQRTRGRFSRTRAGLIHRRGGARRSPGRATPLEWRKELR